MGDGPAKIQYPQTLNYTIPDPSVKICAKLTEYQGEAGVIDYCRVDSDKKINEVGLTLPDPSKLKEDDKKLKGIKGVIDYNTRLFWTLGGAPQLAGIYEQVQNVPTSKLKDKCTGQSWNDLIINMNAARKAKNQSPLSIPSDAVQGLQTFCMDRGYEALQSSSRSSFQQGVLAMQEWIDKGDQEKEVKKQNTQKEQVERLSAIGIGSNTPKVVFNIDIDFDSPSLVDLDVWSGWGEKVSMETKQKKFDFDFGGELGIQEIEVTQRIYTFEQSESFGDEEQAPGVIGTLTFTFINGICVSGLVETATNSAKKRDAVLLDGDTKVTKFEIFDSKYNNLKIGTAISDWWSDDAEAIDKMPDGAIVNANMYNDDWWDNGDVIHTDRKKFLILGVNLLAQTHSLLAQGKAELAKGAEGAWSSSQQQLLASDVASLQATLTQWDQVSSGDKEKLVNAQTPFNTLFIKPPPDKIPEIMSKFKEQLDNPPQQNASQSGATPQGGASSTLVEQGGKGPSSGPQIYASETPTPQTPNATQYKGQTVYVSDTDYQLIQKMNADSQYAVPGQP